MEKIIIEITKSKDNIKKVVDMFNYEYKWDVEKWEKYYEKYPCEGARSFIAVNGVELIGHYGVLPIRIGEYRALLGVHAYIKTGHRNLVIIDELLKKVYEYAKENDYAFVCGFSNNNFSEILKKIFKWRLIGYLFFDNKSEIELKSEYKYKFIYDDNWYLWKFGELQDVYFKDYEKNGEIYKQLLKIRMKKNSTLNFNEDINFWNPNKFLKDCKIGTWNQPFLVKAIKDNLPEDLFDPRHWFIEMGDSDTFEV